MADGWTGPWTYPAIFIALMAAGLGFPVPEEIPVVSAGGLCANAASHQPVDPPDWAAALAVPGVESDPILTAAVAVDWARRDAIPQPRRQPVWWIMLPVCIVGVVTCDAFLYAVGRFSGPHIVEHRWFRFFVNPKRMAEIEDNFHKFGVRLLLGVRLLPGVRAPVFIAAGVVRLPLHRFLLADGIYAIPGVSLLFTLAYWFTDSVKAIVHNLENQVGSVKHYFVIGGIAALAAWLVYEFWKRRRVTGDPTEVPLIGQKVIKPPHDSADKDDNEKAKESARDRQEVQVMQPSEPTQEPKSDDPRKKWSLRSYLVAGAVLVAACWAVYESKRRRARKN